jgi:hypothetical protein
MSEESGRQQGVGKTGGLPGHHADPATRRLSEDERADTVAMGDVGDIEDEQERGQGDEDPS